MVKTWYVLARCVDYFGMTLFTGGLFFLAFLWPDGAGHGRARKVVGTGWLLGFAGTVAGLGLQGAWAAQRSAADLFDWDLLGQALDTQFGRVWFAKALLWLLAGVVLADLMQRGRNAATSIAWRVGAGVLTLGLLRTTGLTGHAVESGRPLLTQLADLVHLAGICAWIGGWPSCCSACCPGVIPASSPPSCRVIPGWPWFPSSPSSWRVPCWRGRRSAAGIDCPQRTTGARWWSSCSSSRSSS
ncbi:hypothetical protein [Amycolatopsis sp. EV170708-02-1]|uniref:hypothetical protein n=1 Tax=Amycolatopsis sp. EV170708-02-1 TaxID=2919322 RepID=UPI001F0C6ED7|nr:hypothetical protein [Amycolatopsis sp. EV170708-02-1]UMP05891.1 hypothetical protein MJQ72_14165 [Amycolatopsis sp. EV170708-02-1]